MRKRKASPALGIRLLLQTTLTGRLWDALRQWYQFVHWVAKLRYHEMEKISKKMDRAVVEILQKSLSVFQVREKGQSPRSSNLDSLAGPGHRKAPCVFVDLSYPGQLQAMRRSPSGYGNRPSRSSLHTKVRAMAFCVDGRDDCQSRVHFAQHRLGDSQRRRDPIHCGIV